MMSGQFRSLGIAMVYDLSALVMMELYLQKQTQNCESYGYCGCFCVAVFLSDPLLLVLRSWLAPTLVLAAVLALLL